MPQITGYLLEQFVASQQNTCILCKCSFDQKRSFIDVEDNLFKTLANCTGCKRFLLHYIIKGKLVIEEVLFMEAARIIKRNNSFIYEKIKDKNTST